MDAVAEYLGLPPIQVYEVATFYSMFETKPVGRHTSRVCTNISCMLCGGDEMLAHVEKRLGIKVGESTADGRFYLKREEECLAACNNAPMMMVDHVYYENLTPEKVDEILDRHEIRSAHLAMTGLSDAIWSASSRSAWSARGSSRPTARSAATRRGRRILREKPRAARRSSKR